MTEDRRPPARPESTIDGVRAARFGWQEGEDIQHYDGDGNKITKEEWLERMRRKAEQRRGR